MIVDLEILQRCKSLKSIMKRRLLLLLIGLVASLAVCMGYDVPNQGSQPPPGSIKQNLAEKCQNLNDCPTYFGEEQQAYYQQKCCPLGSRHTWHCIQHTEGNRRSVIGACVDPRTCEAGTHGFLNQTIVHGDVYVQLQCVPCEYGHYEPYPAESYVFSVSICRRIWQRCFAEHGKVKSKEGTTKVDVHCRCLWEKDYVPSSKSAECHSRHGFIKDAGCHCILKDCSDGFAVNQDYVCAPKPTTTTTRAPTSAIPPITSAKTPSSKTTRTQSTGFPVILLIIAAAFFGLVLPIFCNS